MLTMRGGAGLGDALYVQGVARHLVERGERLRILSDYPDVFRPLEGKVEVVPYQRIAVDRLAHYAGRRNVAGTSQFQDCCIAAGISPSVEFRFDWLPQNVALIEEVRSRSETARDGWRCFRPIVVVQMPRPPFGRSDGFGMDFLPDFAAIQRAIDVLRDAALIVQVGKGEALHRYEGIDVDLSNKTSVSDVLDVAFMASGFLGPCSFIVPLAECLHKPGLFVWAARHAVSRETVIRQMTPEKVLHGPLSRAVYDTDSDISDAAVAFGRSLLRPVLV